MLQSSRHCFTRLNIQAVCIQLGEAKGTHATNISLAKDLNIAGWSEEEEANEVEAEEEEEQTNLAELPSTLYFGVRGEQVHLVNVASYS